MQKNIFLHKNVNSCAFRIKKSAEKFRYILYFKKICVKILKVYTGDLYPNKMEVAMSNKNDDALIENNVKSTDAEVDCTFSDEPIKTENTSDDASIAIGDSPELKEQETLNNTVETDDESSEPEDVGCEPENSEATEDSIEPSAEKDAEDAEQSELTDEENVKTESESEENAEDEINNSPPLTEEEINDARYLPRVSVVFDENASDAVTEEPLSEENENEVEIYSLNFFDDEEEKKEKEPDDVPEEKEQDPYDPKKPRRVDARFDFVELFVFTLAIVIFITSFIIRHSVVIGPSMENTLYEGERLLISDLFYTPERGDVIVFQDPDTNLKGALVKRVIGIPGDRIEIIEISGVICVFRNGELLLEPYVYVDGKYSHDDIYLTVPEGEYFVMGDHRNNSADSRTFGTIKEESILGKVLLRFYPFDKFGPIEQFASD